MNRFFLSFFCSLALSTSNSIVVVCCSLKKVNDRRCLNSFCLNITDKIGLHPSYFSLSFSFCAYVQERKVSLSINWSRIEPNRSDSHFVLVHRLHKFIKGLIAMPKAINEKNLKCRHNNKNSHSNQLDFKKSRSDLIVLDK